MIDEALYSWFYKPGEKIRSIGFYQNPYQRWPDAKFDHIWAMDSEDNLYVGQFSVYAQHLDEIFEIDNKQEQGFVRLEERPLIEVSNLETKNIIFINRRLRKIAQRFYDYGLPMSALIITPKFELGNTSIYNILKGKPWVRPILK